MKEITYYEAFDGTRFEDEDECMDYENEMKAEESGGLGGIICYDGYKIKSPKDWNDLLCFLDYSEYLYFKTKEAFDLCLKACEYNGTYSEGLTSINTLYKQNEDKSCWITIVEELNDKLKKMLTLEEEMSNF